MCPFSHFPCFPPPPSSRGRRADQRSPVRTLANHRRPGEHLFPNAPQPPAGPCPVLAQVYGAACWAEIYQQIRGDNCFGNGKVPRHSPTPGFPVVARRKDALPVPPRNVAARRGDAASAPLLAQWRQRGSTILLSALPNGLEAQRICLLCIFRLPLSFGCCSRPAAVARVLTPPTARHARERRRSPPSRLPPPGDGGNAVRRAEGRVNRAPGGRHA